LEVENGRLVCPGYPEVACSDKFEVRQKKDLEIQRPQRTTWRHLNVEEHLSNEQVYQDSCPACRLFGSTFFIGRVAISDAYLGGNTVERTEQRDGVGIDRFTGGASSGAKFELEVVSPDVTFETNIHLRNFEVWQLGMLMLVVQDLEDSLIRIGSGRSRGLGAVKGAISEVCISYIGAVNGKATNEVWGLGKFLGDSSYGTSPDDKVTVKHAPTEDKKGIRKTATFSGDSLDSFKQKTIERFVEKVQNWPIPDKMQFEHLQFERVGG
jgi:CRISPR-associated RAMP protein (TIGR02581 family)